MNPKDLKIGGFTGRELKSAYWWVTHKTLIIKIITGFLVVACVGLWGYTLYGATRYFIIDWPAEQRLMAGLGREYIDYQYWREKNRPKDLIFSGIQIFPLSDERYDFVVKVENLNKNWAVTSLQYSFNFTNQERETIKEIFVLPEEIKYLLDLGVTAKTGVGDLNLEIKNIKWRRVPNFAGQKEEMMNFEISQPEFISARQLGLEKLKISQTKFTVTNKSLYNFWEIGYYVILYQGSEIIGINYIVKDIFNFGDKQEVEVVWFQNLSRPTLTEVIPDVNILDPEVFRPAEGGVGELK